MPYQPVWPHANRRLVQAGSKPATQVAPDYGPLASAECHWPQGVRRLLARSHLLPQSQVWSTSHYPASFEHYTFAVWESHWHCRSKVLRVTRRIATPATLTANVGQWRSALFPIDLLIGAGSQLEGGSQSLRPKRQEASNKGSSHIQASLRMSSRRGKRAALMYDRQPVIDRLGLMDLRSMPQSFSSCSPAIGIMPGACTGRCCDLPVRTCVYLPSAVASALPRWTLAPSLCCSAHPPGPVGKLGSPSASRLS